MSAFSNWRPAAARWWSTWTRSASSIRPGSPRWSARPSGPPRGGSLHAAYVLPTIRELFRLTGLECRMSAARTLAEALEALAAARTTPS